MEEEEKNEQVEGKEVKRLVGDSINLIKLSILASVSIGYNSLSIVVLLPL